MSKSKHFWRADAKKIVTVSSLGLMLPSSIAVGLVLGYILDRVFGTQPWLLILFFFFGTASGITNLLRGISRLQDDREKDRIRENDN